MWLLYPSNVDYEKATDMSLSFMDAQRSGALPSYWPIRWRGDSGLTDKVRAVLCVCFFGLVDPTIGRMISTGLDFLDAERSGVLPAYWPISWRGDYGLSDKVCDLFWVLKCSNLVSRTTKMVLFQLM